MYYLHIKWFYKIPLPYTEKKSLKFADCINCLVATYKLYVMKLHPDVPFLWQKPRSTPVNYADKQWYECKQMGHNPLETFMKTLCESASLPKREYTNHLIGSSCISHLDNKELEARHITALTSHKSKARIQEYSVHCSENKRKEMFDAPDEPLANAKKKKKTIPLPPKEVNKHLYSHRWPPTILLSTSQQFQMT